MTYEIRYDADGKAGGLLLDGTVSIPIDERNRHYRKFLEWNAAQRPENRLDLDTTGPKERVSKEKTEIETELSALTTEQQRAVDDAINAEQRAKFIQQNPAYLREKLGIPIDGDKERPP